MPIPPNEPRCMNYHCELKEQCLRWLSYKHEAPVTSNGNRKITITSYEPKKGKCTKQLTPPIHHD